MSAFNFCSDGLRMIIGNHDDNTNNQSSPKSTWYPDRWLTVEDIYTLFYAKNHHKWKELHCDGYYFTQPITCTDIDDVTNWEKPSIASNGNLSAPTISYHYTGTATTLTYTQYTNKTAVPNSNPVTYTWTETETVLNIVPDHWYIFSTSSNTWIDRGLYGTNGVNTMIKHPWPYGYWDEEYSKTRYINICSAFGTMPSELYNKDYEALDENTITWFTNVVDDAIEKDYRIIVLGHWVL